MEPFQSVPYFHTSIEHDIWSRLHMNRSPDAPLVKIMQEKEIQRENIQFLEEIGSGCFGKVYKGNYVYRILLSFDIVSTDYTSINWSKIWQNLVTRE